MNRLDFLKTISLLAAGIAVGPKLLAKETSEHVVHFTNKDLHDVGFRLLLFVRLRTADRVEIKHSRVKIYKNNQPVTYLTNDFGVWVTFLESLPEDTTQPFIMATAIRQKELTGTPLNFTRIYTPLSDSEIQIMDDRQKGSIQVLMTRT